MPDIFFNLNTLEGGIGPEGTTILDVFAPPRDEYKKASSEFGV